MLIYLKKPLYHLLGLPNFDEVIVLATFSVFNDFFKEVLVFIFDLNGFYFEIDFN
jgi:hypothetical protein